MNRCSWCGTDPGYVAYHDSEWGVPVRDDRKLFEFLTLEGAQAGLNWLMILRKRENYRRAFANFDAKIVATWGETEIEKLLLDAGIVRNRAKIKAAIGNARAFLEVQARHGSFSQWQWRYVDGKPIVNQHKGIGEVPATSAISNAMSKDMKALGFRFVGSTVLYAHMQACGMVNDHLLDCFRHSQLR